MDLLWEFASPVAECALHAPYSVQQRLIYSACRVLEHSSAHATKPPTPAHQMGWDVFKILAAGHATATRLMSAIGNLDAPAFQTATANYRHRATHRRPPELDVGIHADVSRRPEADGSTTYSVNVEFPLSLAVVVGPLLAEHGRAKAAFEKLWTLIREVEKELATA